MTQLKLKSAPQFPSKINGQTPLVRWILLPIQRALSIFVQLEAFRPVYAKIISFSLSFLLVGSSPSLEKAKNIKDL